MAMKDFQPMNLDGVQWYPADPTLYFTVTSDSTNFPVEVYREGPKERTCSHDRPLAAILDETVMCRDCGAMFDVENF